MFLSGQVAYNCAEPRHDGACTGDQQGPAQRRLVRVHFGEVLVEGSNQQKVDR
jgi:hypothetical protein